MLQHNHYELLQVAPEAEFATIKSAYRRLSRKYHPDNRSPFADNRMQQQLNAAWEVLGHPQTRARYDDVYGHKLKSQRAREAQEADRIRRERKAASRQDSAARRKAAAQTEQEQREQARRKAVAEQVRKDYARRRAEANRAHLEQEQRGQGAGKHQAGQADHESWRREAAEKERFRLQERRRRLILEREGRR